VVTVVVVGDFVIDAALMGLPHTGRRKWPAAAVSPPPAAQKWPRLFEQIYPKR
jgi:hypothetical protein